MDDNHLLPSNYDGELCTIHTREREREGGREGEREGGREIERGREGGERKERKEVKDNSTIFSYNFNSPCKTGQYSY